MAKPCSRHYALTTVVAAGDELWVAAGKYTPGSVVSTSFQLKNGVSVYGGFAMTETERNQRNFGSPAILMIKVAGEPYL